MAIAPSGLRPGQRLSDRYELGRVFADSGGMGLLFTAHDTRTKGNEVLVKTVRYDSSEGQKNFMYTAAEAVQHALQYARDMGRELADKFVGMYVNHWTLDYGERGREAIRRFLGQAHERGLIPCAPELEFVQ